MTFSQQMQRGRIGEKALDRFLGHHHRLWPASPTEERRGIDRHAKHLLTGARYTLQYKTDGRAAATGNAFIEEVSVRRLGAADVPGWAYTCWADWLVYLISGTQAVYFIAKPRQILPALLHDWAQRYPSTSVKNDGYETIGTLVPLGELDRIANLTTFLD